MSATSAPAASLIPNIDTYIANDMNVLLIGRHGVGKTIGLFEAAARHGLNVKYFSASTLDPFTDLVGVPAPIDDPSRPGGKTLLMVRDRSLDDVEGLFFDELNRADPKTLNAVFEIIQFHTINGEPLPKLRFVWAAINPPTEEQTYDVEDLDPALVDRFDAYHEIKPSVSVPYLVNQGIPKNVAQTFQDWWAKNHTASERTTQDGRSAASYISPRRIEKMARIVVKTKDPRIIKSMFPPGGLYDSGKLVQNLTSVMGGTVAGGTGLAGPPEARFEPYNKTSMQQQMGQIEQHLKSGVATQETINKIVAGLSNGIGANQLAFSFGDIIQALPAIEAEGMIAGWSGQKRGEFKRHWGEAFTQGRVSVKEPWGASTGHVQDPLSGHKVCITGTLVTSTRSEFEHFITDAGGTFTNTMSQEVTMLLVANDRPGQNKLEEARRLHTPMISEDNFMDGLSTGNFVYDVT